MWTRKEWSGEQGKREGKEPKGIEAICVQERPRGVYKRRAGNNGDPRSQEWRQEDCKFKFNLG